jgi:hypothetical protein
MMTRVSLSRLFNRGSHVKQLINLLCPYPAYRRYPGYISKCGVTCTYVTLVDKFVHRFTAGIIHHQGALGAQADSWIQGL